MGFFSCSGQALKGLGIERHLLGLKLQAIEGGLSIPKIFMDTAYGLATHWKLRTGQVCVTVCVGWFEIYFTENVGRRQEAQQEVGIFCEYVRGNFLSISGFGVVLEHVMFS